MKVIILCGVSGSGKSTIAKEIGSGYVVSADDFFMASGEYKFDPTMLPAAHGQCLRDFVGCLQYGCDTIVVDNTNTTMMEVAHMPHSHSHMDTS